MLDAVFRNKRDDLWVKSDLMIESLKVSYFNYVLVIVNMFLILLYE